MLTAMLTCRSLLVLTTVVMPLDAVAEADTMKLSGQAKTVAKCLPKGRRK